MLRTYACRLVHAENEQQRYAAMIAAIDICTLRYPMCKPTLLGYINKILGGMGVSPVEDYSLAQDLLEKLTNKLLDEGEGRLFKVRSSREAGHIAKLAQHIATQATLAVMDALGIECT